VNLRKIFNIPNKEQKRLIDLHVEILKDHANTQDRDYSRKHLQYQEDHDGTCPNCGKKEIVNKISRVQGEGSVGGSFALGFGSVHGSSSTDTNSVNHCNSCGNQWKKYSYEVKWSSDFYSDWFNALDEVRKGNEWDFQTREIDALKKLNVSAEAIHKMKKHACDMYSSAEENVTLSYLRKEFPSVYDM